MLVFVIVFYLVLLACYRWGFRKVPSSVVQVPLRRVHTQATKSQKQQTSTFTKKQPIANKRSYKNLAIKIQRNPREAKAIQASNRKPQKPRQNNSNKSNQTPQKPTQKKQVQEKIPTKRNKHNIIVNYPVCTTTQGGQRDFIKLPIWEIPVSVFLRQNWQFGGTNLQNPVLR